MLDEVQGLVKELGERSSTNFGPEPNRDLAIAVLFRMGTTTLRPDISARYKELSNLHPLAQWAHDYPGDSPNLSGVYRGLKQMLNEHSPKSAVEANFAMIRRLGDLTDDQGNLKHPDIGKRLVVDGVLIEANEPQGPFVSDEHRRRTLKQGRYKVTHLRYVDEKGETTKRVRGWKLIVIGDMSTTLPLVAKLFPATVDEREACLELIEWLFTELWSECPAEVLVGDALYEHSKIFIDELMSVWAIQPVFHRRGSYSKELLFYRTYGTATCRHGLMKMRGTEGFTKPSDRKENGRASELIVRTSAARIRWVCPEPASQRCSPVTTRPYEDPRIYTYYPRGGDHQRAWMRKALETRRNCIESLFSSLHHLAVTGSSPDRAKWAGDAGAEWLLVMALMSRTANRLTDELGLYEKARNEADLMGLLTPALRPELLVAA